MSKRENKTVLKTYRRYLQTINDSNTNIAENFLKMDNWLFENADEDIAYHFMIHNLFSCVRFLKEKGINCKNSSGGKWNGAAVKEACKKLERLQEQSDDIYGSAEQFSILFTAFNKFVGKLKQDTPWSYLYVYECYSDKPVGIHLSIPSKCESYQVVEKWLKNDTFSTDTEPTVTTPTETVQSDTEPAVTTLPDSVEDYKRMMFDEVEKCRNFEELSARGGKLRKEIADSPYASVLMPILNRLFKEKSNAIKVSMASEASDEKKVS